MVGLLRWVLISVHFVCPLLFFTDLTRNPYVTQIALLNIGLLAAAAVAVAGQAREGEWKLPKTPLDLPLLTWAGLCVASWTIAYFGHAHFFRESIKAEGLRGMLFLGINSLVPFWLAALCARDCAEEPGLPLGGWVAFALLWGALWLAFPQMRAGVRSFNDVWAHVWDPYGALLWVGGLAAVLALSRGGTVHHVWHVILLTTFLASAYGIVQYFSHEPIWPKVLNPYGGRSVSSFGNPNFMSSQIVMVLPLAAIYYLQERSRARRAVYALVLLTLEGGLLSSLTRSSWVGAGAALAPLAFSPRLRARLKEDAEFHGLVGTVALIMLFAWPASNVEGYAASFIGRLAEVAQIGRDDGVIYSPWYQRVLIWSCAWLMGAENPLLGKGWGLFELFYPFYQGHMMDQFELFRHLRTHANNAHNEVMEIWAQTGILGVGALAWVWATFMRFAPWRNPWMLAGAAGVLGMLVDNLLNVSVHFAVPGMLFWWQAGTVMGHLAYREGWLRRLPLRGRWAALSASLAVVMAGLGAWHWVRQWNREVYYFMGFKAMRRGPVPLAVDILEKAYKWHPREVNANYELGNGYARSERPDKAAWAYREALNANAGYDEIYFNLGTILSRLGDFEGAVKHFSVSRAINPMSPQLYEAFSRLYLADPGRHRAACVELLESAVRLYPKDINFLNNLGYLYSLGAEHAKAEGVYAQALRLRPDMNLAEQNLRLSLAQSKNKPPAVLQAVQGLRELEAKLKVGDFGPKSLALARRAREEFPDSAMVAFYVGNLELANGNFAAAEAGLNRSLEEEPNNINSLLNLSQAYRGQGKISQAAQAIQRALAVDPNNAQARQLLETLPK